MTLNSLRLTACDRYYDGPPVCSSCFPLNDCNSNIKTSGVMKVLDKINASVSHITLKPFSELSGIFVYLYSLLLTLNDDVHCLQIHSGNSGKHLEYNLHCR